MSVIPAVLAAIELIKQGREAIEKITDSIKDGKQAVSTDEVAELNRLLASEAIESKAAHDALDAAIAAAKAKK